MHIHGLNLITFGKYYGPNSCAHPLDTSKKMTESIKEEAAKGFNRRKISVYKTALLEARKKFPGKAHSPEADEYRQQVVIREKIAIRKKVESGQKRRFWRWYQQQPKRHGDWQKLNPDNGGDGAMSTCPHNVMQSPLVSTEKGNPNASLWGNIPMCVLQRPSSLKTVATIGQAPEYELIFSPTVDSLAIPVTLAIIGLYRGGHKLKTGFAKLLKKGS